MLKSMDAEKRGPKTCQNPQNIIVDAERHRRTPGHRPLEARRWEARNRQASATSAENNTGEPKLLKKITDKT